MSQEIKKIALPLLGVCALRKIDKHTKTNHKKFMRSIVIPHLQAVSQSQKHVIEWLANIF